MKNDLGNLSLFISCISKRFQNTPGEKFTKEQIDRIDRATRPCLMTVYLLSR